ncbi:MAG: tetratricopeptide repeat protein [Bdellovibrionales bacterium]|nr:tetratricopeptide repeat protein [Ramlibacter sp.]
MDLEHARETFARLGAALKQNPASVDTRLALVKVCLAMEDGISAVAWQSDACRIAPQHPELWTQLAQLLADQGREAEVEPALRLGLAANPGAALLLTALAEYCLDRKRHGEALAIYQALVPPDPRNTRNLLHHGICLEHTYSLAEAAASYKAALAVKPDYLEAHMNLGSLLWRLEDHEGSLKHARRAHELQPDHAFTECILGSALHHLNRLEEAEVHLLRALELQPDFPTAHINLAVLLLLAGRFEGGWRVYKRRWDDTGNFNRPDFYRPEMEWQGPHTQPLKGRRIVIYAEQGLGDVIHFIRYARVMQEEGATVYCSIQPELASLVDSMQGVTVIPPGRNIVADYHVALLDLPMHYGTTGQAMPREVPYLQAPAKQAAAWKARLKSPDGKLKVGIAWAGHHIHFNDNNRSMPLSAFGGITGMPGVQCFSLQKGDGGRFTDVVLDDTQMVDFTAEWGDFGDSAAMIANLDLVICIDSAVAHLAGALGKPIWLILPPNPDWRWLLERDDSPWYPTMKLVRRSHGEAKAAQMARVVEALKAIQASKNP